MYSFHYFDWVLIDIQEAKIWYKKQKEGLEVDFAFAIEKAIEQVIKMPLVTRPVIEIYGLIILKHFRITSTFMLMKI